VSRYDPAKTVIVEVTSGVASCQNAPEGISVVIVDYDSYPDAEVSATGPLKGFPNGKLVVKRGASTEDPWSHG
jgi:hypothetical protein